MISCDNCSQSGIQLYEIQENVPSVFGTMGIDVTVCNTCKSAIEYCIYQHIELYETLTKKLDNRAKQLRNKTKREMK